MAKTRRGYREGGSLLCEGSYKVRSNVASFFLIPNVHYQIALAYAVVIWASGIETQALHGKQKKRGCTATRASCHVPKHRTTASVRMVSYTAH